MSPVQGRMSILIHPVIRQGRMPRTGNAKGKNRCGRIARWGAMARRRGRVSANGRDGLPRRQGGSPPLQSIYCKLFVEGRPPCRPFGTRGFQSTQPVIRQGRMLRAGKANGRAVAGELPARRLAITACRRKPRCGRAPPRCGEVGCICKRGRCGKGSRF